MFNIKRNYLGVVLSLLNVIFSLLIRQTEEHTFGDMVMS